MTETLSGIFDKLSPMETEATQCQKNCFCLAAERCKLRSKTVLWAAKPLTS